MNSHGASALETVTDQLTHLVADCDRMLAEIDTILAAERAAAAGLQGIYDALRGEGRAVEVGDE